MILIQSTGKFGLFDEISYHYLNYTAFVFITLKNFLVHLFQD